ncbi:MAG: hypothetical protein QNK36_18825 [Colwellia sp.]|nr:hypothetical protein [Colwellia sp.]
MISSCQSSLDIASDKHQTSAEKWHALAQYSSTTLAPFSLKVTATLSDLNSLSNTDLRFTEIKLSNKTTAFTINLLAPNFENKYICRPVCIQLVEYLRDNNIADNPKLNGDTALSQYFNKHEFELFQFYSDMFILGDQLDRLAKEDPTNLDRYLQWLAKTAESSISLSTFTQLFKEKLTLELYQYFINNPPAIYPNNALHIIASPENNWALETNDSFVENETSFSQNRTNKTVNPDDLWSNELSPPEGKLWSSKLPPPEGNLWASIKTSSSKSWFESTDNTLDIKDTVCSYNENYFGIVQSVSLEKVNVWVLGQAKIERDGIISNPDEGELFKENIKSIFIPVNELKQFSLSDMSLCELN